MNLKNAKDEKIELIKQECKLAKVPFLRVGQIYSQFWDYLFDIIMQKPHEKKEIQNGLIFTKDYIKEDFQSDIANEKRDYYLDNSSNGTNVFSVISNSDRKTFTLIYRAELTQNELLDFTSDKSKNNIIITRSNTETRVYYHGTISVLDNREWIIYKSKKEIQEILKQNISNFSKEFEILLHFAYYDLALNKIGTTLVYYTDDNFQLKDMEAKDPPNNVDLNNNYERLLLKNYAVNHDGAIIINSENKVLKINAKLSYKNQTLDEIKTKQFTGMRHTSSAAYSYENKNTIIITVSDDGGATVFKDGKVVLNMNSKSVDEDIVTVNIPEKINEKINFITVPNNSGTMQYFISTQASNKTTNTLQKIIDEKQKTKKKPEKKYFNYQKMLEKLDNYQAMAEERGEIGETGTTIAKCPKCGKNYMVGYVRISGWNDHEELQCNNCGTIYYSKSCFELIGEPIPPVSTKSEIKEK